MTAYDPDDAFRRAFPPEGPAPVSPDGGTPGAVGGVTDPVADDGRYLPPPARAQRYGQEPAYGQPAYGQPAYGQPAYGQPAYGQPAYGQQPAYQAPAGPTPSPGYASPGYAPVPYPPTPYGGAPYPGYSPYGYAVAPKSPALALLASFFIPGLGSMLNGEVGKGIGILVGYLVSAVLTIVIIGFVGLLVFWVWGMADAYSGARAWNARHGIVS